MLCCIALVLSFVLNILCVRSCALAPQDSSTISHAQFQDRFTHFHSSFLLFMAISLWLWDYIQAHSSCIYYGLFFKCLFYLHQVRCDMSYGRNVSLLRNIGLWESTCEKLIFISRKQLHPNFFTYIPYMVFISRVIQIKLNFYLYIYLLS